MGNSYTDKFLRKPRCFGEKYDSEDAECRKECPFREDCYEVWEKEVFLKEARRVPTTPYYYGRQKEEKTSSYVAEDKLAPLLKIDEIIPYEGEAWYSRLWWNSLSSALSAMGHETHMFFRYYRFPPDRKLLSGRKTIDIDAEVKKK